MAFRDLFDTDKRAKLELRSEIERRDEHIEKLLRAVSELRAQNLQAPTQVTKIELNGSELKDKTQPVITSTFDQQKLIEKFEDRTEDLEVLIDKLGKINKNIKVELENERQLRKNE